MTEKPVEKKNRLIEALDRLENIAMTEKASDLLYLSDDVEEISFRVKSFQYADPRRMTAVYQYLIDTLAKIDNHDTPREKIPSIVKDALNWAGLGTQIMPSQQQARGLLMKALWAAEAIVIYYRQYPNKHLDLNLAKDIVAEKLYERKFVW